MPILPELLAKKRPIIMGILNITPDSFSDGGAYLDVSYAVDHAASLIKDGVDILDIGGESSRPGAESISAEEELERVMPVIEAINSRFDVLLSLDTVKSSVAEQGIQSGIGLINDISGLTHDPAMATVIAASNHPISVVLMHRKGVSDTMQDNPQYDDLISEIKEQLSVSISIAQRHGIQDIVIDPGIGFGKILDHNLCILKNIDHFSDLGFPLLIGVSRKSFIGAIDGSEVEDRLGGSLASQLWAYSKGASIFRVHDVAHAVQSLRVWTAIEDCVYD